MKIYYDTYDRKTIKLGWACGVAPRNIEGPLSRGIRDIYANNYKEE